MRGFVNPETGPEGTENFKFWLNGVALTVTGSQAGLSLMNSPIQIRVPF